MKLRSQPVFQPKPWSACPASIDAPISRQVGLQKLVAAAVQLFTFSLGISSLRATQVLVLLFCCNLEGVNAEKLSKPFKLRYVVRRGLCRSRRSKLLAMLVGTFGCTSHSEAFEECRIFPFVITSVPSYRWLCSTMAEVHFRFSVMRACSLFVFLLKICKGEKVLDVELFLVIKSDAIHQNESEQPPSTSWPIGSACENRDLCSRQAIQCAGQ